MSAAANVLMRQNIEICWAYLICLQFYLIFYVMKLYSRIFDVANIREK